VRRWPAGRGSGGGSPASRAGPGGLLSIVYCLLARSCLGVRAARCVVAPGVPRSTFHSSEGNRETGNHWISHACMGVASSCVCCKALGDTLAWHHWRRYPPRTVVPRNASAGDRACNGIKSPLRGKYLFFGTQSTLLASILGFLLRVTMDDVMQSKKRKAAEAAT
jgi:hypothetical protein